MMEAGSQLKAAIERENRAKAELSAISDPVRIEDVAKEVVDAHMEVKAARQAVLTAARESS